MYNNNKPKTNIKKAATSNSEICGPEYSLSLSQIDRAKNRSEIL